MWSHKSSREPRSVQLFVCRDAKVTAGPPTFDHVSRLTAIVSIDAPDCTFFLGVHNSKTVVVVFHLNRPV